MVFEQLQKRAAPIAQTLEELRREAEQDEFAPWVVKSLELAAHYASLSSTALDEARTMLEEGASS